MECLAGEGGVTLPIYTSYISLGLKVVMFAILVKLTEDLHPSKALFSLDPDNLQLHCFLGLGALDFSLLVFVLLSSQPTMLDVGRRH